MLDADLKEFEDYLSEFNSVPKFDSEICPICGIDYSDAYLGTKIPLVELQFENVSIAQTAIKQLEKAESNQYNPQKGKKRYLSLRGNLRRQNQF